MVTTAVALDGASIWTPERVTILDDVTWAVRGGERWVVVGANGAGKTTLLSLISADRHPSAGSVALLGEQVGRTDMRVLRSRIGKVDPNGRLLDWLTAREVVLTGFRNSIWPKWEEWTPDNHAAADDLLRLVGCGDFSEREFATLSQGERQRVRIARMLIRRPELLLLDEPATGLDFPAREALLGSIDALAASQLETPMVMVSHHLEDLPTCVTHALLLRSGQVMDAGPIEEMLTSSRVSVCFGFPITVTGDAGRWSARAAAGWTVGASIA